MTRSPRRGAAVMRARDAHATRAGRFPRVRPLIWGFAGAAGAGIALALLGNAALLAPLILDCALALFAALALQPVVRLAARVHMSRWMAVTATTLLLLAAAATIIIVIGPIVVQQLTTLISVLPSSPDQALKSPIGVSLTNALPWVDFRAIIGGVLSSAQNPASLSAFGGGTLAAGTTAAAGLANASICAVLALYFSLTLPTIRATALSCVPASRRDHVADIADEAATAIGRYVLGHLLLAAMNGTFVTLLMLCIGGPTPILFGVISSLCALVPVIGTLIGSTIAAVACLAVSVPTAVTVGIVMIVYMQIESYVLLPRIMKSAVKVSGSVTIIAAFAGAAVGGLIGAFVALPIVGAGTVVFRRVFIPRQDSR